MSGYAFDSNIIIDALAGYGPARDELSRAANRGARIWVSRMVWVEVLSKSPVQAIREAEAFLKGFGVDELDAEIAARAAALRRDSPRLKAPDAIILSTALMRGRILVTRNTKDFPAATPGVRIPYSF